MTDKSYEKSFRAEKDYEVDWSDYLKARVDGGPADTIVTSTWTVTPNTLTVGATAKDDNSTVIWLSGGVVNQKYQVVNTIVTAQGRTDTRWFPLRVTSP